MDNQHYTIEADELFQRLAPGVIFSGKVNIGVPTSEHYVTAPREITLAIRTGSDFRNIIFEQDQVTGSVSSLFIEEQTSEEPRTVNSLTKREIAHSQMDDLVGKVISQSFADGQIDAKEAIKINYAVDRLLGKDHAFTSDISEAYGANIAEAARREVDEMLSELESVANLPIVSDGEDIQLPSGSRDSQQSGRSR